MGPDLLLQLAERFRRYEKLIKEGAWHSAVIRLAEIHHCLPKLPEDQRKAWTKRILDADVSEKALANAEAGIGKDVERIRRILSIGDRWNADEILLVLQKRIEVELLSEFLNQCFSIEAAVFLQDIDQNIESLAKSESHRRHFILAVRQMKQNWGVPIESKWLREAVGL